MNAEAIKQQLSELPEMRTANGRRQMVMAVLADHGVSPKELTLVKLFLVEARNRGLAGDLPKLISLVGLIVDADVALD